MASRKDIEAGTASEIYALLSAGDPLGRLRHTVAAIAGKLAASGHLTPDEVNTLIDEVERRSPETPANAPK